MSRMPKAGSIEVGTTASTGQVSVVTQASVRGCSETRSLIMTPSTGSKMGLSVLSLKLSSQAL